MIPTFAIIPTHNRVQELKQCVLSLHCQVSHLLIIDNASDRPVHADEDLIDGKIFHNFVPDQPPNLSKLWNRGLDWAEQMAEVLRVPEWNVAILNDDAQVSPTWVRTLSDRMREYGADAASSTPFTGTGTQFFGPGTTPGVRTRLTGWAFMVRGESGLRADERFQWWCGDDDLSHQARERGGLVHVDGQPTLNRYPNQSTQGVLAEIAGQDMQRFVEKWGQRPW